MLVMFPLPSRILHYTPLRNVAVRVAQDERIISPRYADDYVDCKSPPQRPSRHILQGRVLALLLNSSCRSRMPKVPTWIVSAGYMAGAAWGSSCVSTSRQSCCANNYNYLFCWYTLVTWRGKHGGAGDWWSFAWSSFPTLSPPENRWIC